MIADKKREYITNYHSKHEETPISWLMESVQLSKNGMFHKPIEKDYFENDLIISVIEGVLTEFPYYGYIRVAKEIKKNHHMVINKKKVQRLMKHAGLLQTKKKAFVPKTTDSNHRLTTYSNVIKDLLITKQGQVWVKDITYIPTQKGFVYCALIHDIHTREIVGYSIKDTMHRSIVIEAFTMAMKSHSAPLYCHSDRGSQYCSHEYIALQKSYDITISMADVGVSVDNAFAESLNRSLKVEEVALHGYVDLSDAKQSIAKWIKQYNEKRLHSSLDYQSPYEFINNLALSKIA